MLASEVEASAELTGSSTFVELVFSGRGGAGDVYRARRGGQLVALKVARDEAGAQLLAREAEVLALADGTVLPRLLATGRVDVRDRDGIVVETGGRAFIAIEWIEGATLDRSSPSSIEGALGVARDVGDALASLHALGVAHGDVKPENIIVDRSGRARLIDVGLAAEVHATAIEGATPRYLALADASMGDARSRDVLALGVTIAELADASIGRGDDPIPAARAATLPAVIAGIVVAAIAPSPGARPSAAWIAERARSLSSRPANAGWIGERDEWMVRATYLADRRRDIERASSASDRAVRWLGPAVERVQAARALAGAQSNAIVCLEPLGVERLARWLTRLVGAAAAAWPFASLQSIDERALGDALTDLARRRTPRAWTFRDVEAAISGEVSGPRESASIADVDVATLALAVARLPPNPLALAAVEARDDAPPAVIVAAADALRLLGESGRARALLSRPGVLASRGGEAIAAEIARRAGDLEAATTHARRAIDRDDDDDDRAAATLGRLAIDRGALDEAEVIAGHGKSARLAEVAAIAAIGRGDGASAAMHVARGEALAKSSEERSRLAGLAGYVNNADDPFVAHTAYERAADFAVRAGAVEEEATYRTGEAAAAVGIGALGAAIDAGRRAALLWEHLGKPALAARARLAIAAAFSTAGRAVEATQAAHDAIESARQGGDRRAEAYANWAIADAADAIEGRAAVERAADLLTDATPEDELRSAARLVRFASPMIDEVAAARFDDRAASTDGLPVVARLEWWAARATQSVIAGATSGARVDRILRAIVALADAPAPIATRGPALAAGLDLAARAGRGDLAQRLLSTLGDVARTLVGRASSELVSSVRELPWVARAATSVETQLSAEQARDLEQLVRSLGERERLRPLLDRVVDALVLWTGVERGLLLLRAPDGRLVPRAARNLARADLSPEQLGLSQTLARRALDAREPVVAVDATGELSIVHESVHALKLRSVLAVPLIARGEPLGVVYLDDRIRRGAFGERELGWASTIAALAAVAIADARDQVLLRRAARRAKRATEALGETLARREATLEVVEKELATVRGARATRFKYDAIIGESDAIRAMLRLVDRVTAAEVPVLLSGESGSGKELVARAIHENGSRRARAFVGENCGAIPEGLLESALFGHVKGAFTGASSTRAGLFEIADRGTLFLDEIGEMSLGMQTKLLRVLEDGLVKPVGSERTRHVDVRVIAATHRDLEAMVKAKTFREDLFYRLNIIGIRVPPLRERSEDIPLLISRFVREHAKGAKVKITPAAMERLASFAWPGNVRQLQNEVRRALVLSDGTIDEKHLSPEIAKTPASPERDAGLNVRKRIDALERALVRDAIERTRGNQTQAAKLLGLSRFGLQKMIKRLEIEVTSSRGAKKSRP